MSERQEAGANVRAMAIFMCLIEFAERASYYGSKGPFNNFINNPLPAGSTTGELRWTVPC